MSIQVHLAFGETLRTRLASRGLSVAADIEGLVKTDERSNELCPAIVEMIMALQLNYGPV